MHPTSRLYPIPILDGNGIAPQFARTRPETWTLAEQGRQRGSNGGSSGVRRKRFSRRVSGQHGCEAGVWPRTSPTVDWRLPDRSR